MPIRAALFFLAIAFMPAFVPAQPINPPELKQGDTIALVAPSRYVDTEKVEKITTALERMGFRVTVAGNVLTKYGYLAGTDEERAAGIMNAWRDPDTTAIFCLTGGYGATRMLDLLDYTYIQNNPKIITGFSDITALHLAISKKSNLVTFHSPTNSDAYAAEFEERPVQAEGLWRAIMPSRDPRTGAPFPAGPVVYNDDGLSTKIVTLARGKAQGRLIGGNLSVLHALMGTEYEVDTEGKLLFLEDVGEDPYRIDRMLSTLKMAGKLEECAGVILGQWSKCETDDTSRSFTLRQTLDLYFRDAPYPVIYNFPVGHVVENTTLPEGVLAELDADARTLTLLETPTSRKE